MKKFILLNFLSAIALNALQAQYTQQWASFYDGATTSQDQGKSMVVDASGNTYVTGTSYDAAGGDYVTVKYNAAGTQLWSAVYDRGSSDLANAIALDASGNVYVTGESYNAAGNADAVTVKYNAAGVQQWASIYNGTANGPDQGTGIAVDGSGNIFITGEVRNTTTNGDILTVKYNTAGGQLWAMSYDRGTNNIDHGIGIVIDAGGNAYVGGWSLNSGTGMDFTTIKYNSSGVYQWASFYNGGFNGTDEPHGVALDASNNVILSGSVQTATSNYDYATVKYNSAGTQQWVRTYDWMGSYDYGLDVETDASSNVYITGYCYIGFSTSDMVTIKYNSAGTVQWTQNFDNAGALDEGSSLTVDAGNVYVTGRSTLSSNQNYATVKYNSAGAEQWRLFYNGSSNTNDVASKIVADGLGSIYVTGYANTTTGGDDYATIKYSAAGAQTWIALYTGMGSAITDTRGMTVDASGNSYVVGSISTNIQGYNGGLAKFNNAGVQQWNVNLNGPGNNFDAFNAVATDAAGNVYVTGVLSVISGNFDCFIAKYNSSGVSQWTYTYNGPGNSTDIGNDIKLDASGNVYVTGESIGSGTGSDFMTIMLNNSGSQQWVSRYTSAGNNYDGAIGLGIDNSGNVYVNGIGYGINDDIVTVKYNSTGVQQWVMFYNGSNNQNDQAKGISVDGSGNTFVTGQVAGTGGYTDVVTIMYNSAGIQQWATLFGAPSASEGASAITLDASGNIYVSGTGNFSFLYSEILAIKYNGSGVQQWATYYHIPTYGYCYSSAITTDVYGNVYSAGYARNSLGDDDFATVKFNAAGVQQWTATYAGTDVQGDRTVDVVVDASLNVYVGGNVSNLSTERDMGIVKYSQPLPLSSTQSHTDVTCNASCNGTATVVASGGTGPYTYSWSPSGGTGATASGLCAGTYTCTITDAGAITSTQTFTITEPTALTSGSTASSIACNGGNTTITVTGAGGMSPYTGTGNFTTTAGPHSYIITDANGCTSTTSITVTQPAVLTSSSSSTPISCNGGSSTITVAGSGGTSPYGGTGNFTVSAGPQSYIVTDANGCTSTTTITVTEPTVLTSSTSSTAILCNGGNSTITVSGSGGTLPYGGTGNFTVAAGPQSYVVTDANGCTSTTTITVTEPSALSSSSSASSILCSGGNATITVGASGGTSPYSGTGNYIVSAGLQSYIVTDSNGCTSTTTITVTEPTAIQFSTVVSNVLCSGGSTGSINAATTGGTGSFTFDWNSGAFTTEDISSIAMGTYTIVVTDSNACTFTQTVSVTEPAMLMSSVVSFTNPTTCSGTDGTLDVTTTGGTSGYTYLWSNAATSEDLNAIGAGAYTYTVTDANGCTASGNASLNDPSAPTVTLSLPLDTICQTTTSAFALTGETPSGGVFTGPGVTAGIFDPMMASVGMNTVSYTFTDLNGCTGTTSDSMYIDLCLDVASTDTEPFAVFPNPNSGAFTVQLNITAGASFVIYNSLGQIVLKNNVESTGVQQVQLDSEGTYVIVLTFTEGTQSTRRVVVTH